MWDACYEFWVHILSHKYRFCGIQVLILARYDAEIEEIGQEKNIEKGIIKQPAGYITLIIFFSLA